MPVIKGGREFEFDEGFEPERARERDAEEVFRRQAAQRLGKAFTEGELRKQSQHRGSVETVVVLLALVGLGVYLIGSFFKAWMPTIGHLR